MMKQGLFSSISLPGPENISRVLLPNGLTVLARANMESPSVIVAGYFLAGSINDTDDKLGLAHFTALGLMRGTEKRSFQQIYTGLENIGASLSFGSGVHTVRFSGRSLIEDLPFLLTLLIELLSTPSFPSAQVGKLRSQLLTGLSIREQDTGEMASLEFDKILFPNHPYGRPEDGYAETIRAISRNDLINFQSQYYGPKGGVIVLVGPLDKDKATDMLSNIFGRWQNPNQPNEPPLPTLTARQGIRRHHVPILGKTQIDLVIGTLGPSRFSSDYYPASLGNNILGQFGMMGRIGNAVREKSGLAYYAYSSLNAGVGPGSWEFIAGVNPTNLDRTIALIQKEQDRFIRYPVKPVELSDIKTNLIGRLPLALESNSGVASALINLERFQLGLDYYLNYASMIKAISREEILETARKYLNPQNMVISTAGTIN